LRGEGVGAGVKKGHTVVEKIRLNCSGLGGKFGIEKGGYRQNN